MKIQSSQSWWHRLICNQQYPIEQVYQLIAGFDQSLDSVPKLLKNDSSSTVAMVVLNGLPVVVKRANHKNIWQRFRRSFSRSRASKNWHNTLMLRQNEIPTFIPIAMFEKRWGPLCLGSYFLCTYIDAPSALDYFRDRRYQAQWPLIAQKIASLINRLNQLGICHRDLNLSNILIVENEPWLIDLESVKKAHWRFGARQRLRRCHQKLLKNWVETPQAFAESLEIYKKLSSQINFDTFKNCDKIS